MLHNISKTRHSLSLSAALLAFGSFAGSSVIVDTTPKHTKTSQATAVAKAAAAAASAHNEIAARIAAIEKKNVTIKFDDVNIKTALRTILKSVGANYIIDVKVNGNFSASLVNVPFNRALRAVLQANQSFMPLDYKIENGIYIIFPKTVLHKSVVSATPSAKSNSGSRLANTDSAAQAADANGNLLPTEEQVYLNNTDPTNNYTDPATLTLMDPNMSNLGGGIYFFGNRPVTVYRMQGSYGQLGGGIYWFGWRR